MNDQILMRKLYGLADFQEDSQTLIRGCCSSLCSTR